MIVKPTDEVRLGEPTATDNYQLAGPAVCDPYVSGENTVTCRAEDTAGNEGTCTVTITIGKFFQTWCCIARDIAGITVFVLEDQFSTKRKKIYQPHQTLQMFLL